MTPKPTPALADDLLEVGARRRVVRQFDGSPVDRSLLTRLAEAAYWAPSGGARKPVRLVAVQEPAQLRQVVAVSPGIIGNPAALLLLCADWSRAPHLEVDDARDTHSTHVDIGAAMENILVMCEALGLGACPVMSFHRASVSTVLGLPESWTPLIMVVLGYAAVQRKARVRTPELEGFLYWERYADAAVGGRA